jgi:hypothetical protein
MPSEGFEPKVAETKRPQTYFLVRAALGIKLHPYFQPKLGRGLLY